jgi:hypothetical protein
MVPSAAIRGFCTTLLLTLAVNSSAGQRPMAADAIELGNAWQAAAALDAPGAPAGLAVDVRFDALRAAAATGGILALPLPGGATARFAIRWTQSDALQTFLAGPLVSGEGEVSLTVVGDAMSGRIVVNGRVFVVRRIRGSAAHRVSELDQASLPAEASPLVPPVIPAASPEARSPQGRGTTDGAQPAGDSNGFVDVMVLYTPTVLGLMGSNQAMAAEVTGSVNNANLALANAGVTHRYRLIYSQITQDYEESGYISSTLAELTQPNDGYLDWVHDLRNQYRADIVTLLSTDDDACGIGYLMDSSRVNAAFEKYAFNVVNWSCANVNLTLAHEIGHNMGLQHDRPYASTTPAFPYAFGYAVNGVARDVMAYNFNCPAGCVRKAIYSTPLFNFPGTSVTAGTATEDNARALNGTSPVVANFRQSLCTVTLSSLTATYPSGGGPGIVSVDTPAFCGGWSATSSNPSFLTVTGATGAGPGVVTFTVAPNGGPAARGATLTIAGVTFTVFEAGRNNTGDMDGDGKSEIAIFRPSSGSWYILKSATSFTGGSGYAWGASTDIPVTGDFDGDGKHDITVFRASTGHWFVLKSSTNFTTSLTYQWGGSGDKPVPADYDGDGKTDLAVYRPSNGTWYVRTSNSEFANSFSYVWGVGADVPVPGDYDGDMRADIVVFRPSTAHWFILTSGSNYANSVAYQWGTTDDVPVAGNYDGDTRADIAIYRKSNGTWYILSSSSNFTAGAGYAWGASTDTPVPADYDGDGRTDVAVYRSSSAHWFILKSTTNFTTSITYQWGTTGDIPVLRRP